jgi:hypothetical protein
MESRTNSLGKEGLNEKKKKSEGGFQYYLFPKGPLTGVPFFHSLSCVFCLILPRSLFLPFSLYLCGAYVRDNPSMSVIKFSILAGSGTLLDKKGETCTVKNRRQNLL